jgi:hypothetical protein
MLRGNHSGPTKGAIAGAFADAIEFRVPAPYACAQVRFKGRHATEVANCSREKPVDETIPCDKG